VANQMTEICQNCGGVIGKLETPMIWKENVVCGICYKKLNQSATPSSSQVASVVSAGQREQVKSPVNEGKVLSLFTIFAYILGGIGILVAWIPFVGILCIPAAILGIIFAIIGLVRDKTRGRSIGLPIGASILCVADIVIFIVMTSVAVAGIAANTPTQTILNSSDHSISNPQAVATPSTPIGIPLQAGDAQVTVTAATLGTVQLIGIDGTPETSTDSCIEVSLTINNTSATKIINYSTWRGDVLGQYLGSLMDDAGNQY